MGNNKPTIDWTDKEQVLNMMRDLLIDQESLYDENVKRMNEQHDREVRQQNLRIEELKAEKVKAEVELKKFNRAMLAVALSISGIIIALLITFTVLLYGTNFVIETNSNSESYSYSTESDGDEYVTADNTENKENTTENNNGLNE